MKRDRPLAILAPCRKEQGSALLTSLLLMAILMSVSSSGLVLSRSDLIISKNVVEQTKTLWIAAAGTEVGKNWLEANLGLTALPTTLGPTTVGDGDYTVTIDRYTPGTVDGRYRIVAAATGLENAEKVVEEVVRVINPLAFPAVINVDGNGIDPDFDDGSGGTGRKIPDFSIDGRNHDLAGTGLSVACQNVSPLAGTDPSIQTEIMDEISDLQCEMVKRANAFCNQSGGGSDCTPGLYWMRGSGASPRYDDDAGCNTADPDCCKNFDLTAPELRAMAVLDNSVNPPLVSTPPAPEDRGPFLPIDGADPLVKGLNSTESTTLSETIDQILAYAAATPSGQKIVLSSDINGGTHTFGSLSEPTIVEANGPIDIGGNAIINGVGILIVRDRLRIRDATFNWTGIVLVLDNGGELRVDDEEGCGSITGVVVLQDDGGAPRIDVDKVGSDSPLPARCLAPTNPTGPTVTSPPYDRSPFTFNYSCEAAERALVKTMRTVSWVEQFGS